MDTDREIRQKFQQHLKLALDEYYPFWLSENLTDRPLELPDKETLIAWIETHQHPQVRTFGMFLERSVFPDETKIQLKSLYHQIPRRRRARKNDLKQELEIAKITETQPSRRTKKAFVFGAGTLVLSVLLIVVIFVLSRSTPPSVWCTENAVNTQVVKDIALLSFDATVPLRDFNQNPYYIYFDNTEYVAGEFLSGRKLDANAKVWVYVVGDSWIQMHPNWQTPQFWRVEYPC